MTISTSRSRWAAIGAAVAVTLGAGGIGISHATTDSGEMPIYKPIEPCRLADTRPAPVTVGPRTTGIGPAETYDLDGWGTVGNCTLPSDTAGLSLNVTAVGATAQTNLRFFPKGAALPTAANLNPTPGAPPTPNAVNVALNSTDGQFSVYNAFGTVAVVIDVVGYYDDHVHTGDDIVDGSLTGADVEDGSITGDDVADASISNVDTGNEPGVVYNTEPDNVTLDGTVQTIVSTFMRVPTDGHVAIEVTGMWNAGSAATDGARCQLQKGAPAAIDFAEPWFWLWDRNPSGTGYSVFSAHRMMPIALADNPALFTGGQQLSLVCEEAAGSVELSDIHISGTYFASSYNPVIFTIPTIPIPIGP